MFTSIIIVMSLSLVINPASVVSSVDAIDILFGKNQSMQRCLLYLSESTLDLFRCSEISHSQALTELLTESLVGDVQCDLMITMR